MRTPTLLITLLVYATTSAAAQSASSLSGSVREYVSVAEPVVALTNVRVVDGTGAPARDNQTVIIRDGRIEAVGPTGDVNVPSDARVMDLQGHTVLPGIVGLHNHTFYMTSQRTIQINYSAPRLYLASGVTTIRTTGSIAPYSELNLKNAVETGQEVGPRMHVTGPYISSGPITVDETRLLESEEDARRVVAYWAEEGVQWMKAYDGITREQLAAAIDEAHKHGIKLTGHLCSVSFREAVALGIDNLEHGFFTNTDYYPDKQESECPSGNWRALLEVDMDGPEVAATIRDMIENNVGLTSTLAIFEPSVPHRPPLEDRMLEAMAPAVREEYLATREQVSGMSQENAATITELLERSMKFEYMFAKAGGVLAAGVDPTGYGGALPGFGDQRNYELLLEAGFTPVEAIQIMTANGARILDVDDELGTVEAGKLADLIVINGDPVNNHAEIRNVVVVFKDGVGYDSAKLIASVKGQVGIR